MTRIRIAIVALLVALCTMGLATDIGGATVYRLITANTNNSNNIKASAGTLYSIQSCGGTGTNYFIKLYDKASAPTCGTDTPIMVLSTGNSGVCNSPNLPAAGLRFGLGLGICVVTGVADNDNTSAAASGGVITIGYK
jgi:hypothetical protein